MYTLPRRAHRSHRRLVSSPAAFGTFYRPIFALIQSLGPSHMKGNKRSCERDCDGTRSALGLGRIDRLGRDFVCQTTLGAEVLALRDARLTPIFCGRPYISIRAAAHVAATSAKPAERHERLRRTRKIMNPQCADRLDSMRCPGLRLSRQIETLARYNAPGSRCDPATARKTFRRPLRACATASSGFRKAAAHARRDGSPLRNPFGYGTRATGGQARRRVQVQARPDRNGLVPHRDL